MAGPVVEPPHGDPNTKLTASTYEPVDLMGIKKLCRRVDTNVLWAGGLDGEDLPGGDVSTRRARSENEVVTGESLNGMVECALKMALRREDNFAGYLLTKEITSTMRADGTSAGSLTGSAESL